MPDILRRHPLWDFCSALNCYLERGNDIFNRNITDAVEAVTVSVAPLKHRSTSVDEGSPQDLTEVVLFLPLFAEGGTSVGIFAETTCLTMVVLTFT